MARKSKREQYKGANGTGTVYERPNGRWQGQVTIGVKADGTLRRLSKTFGTKNEAVAWVRKQLVSIEEGTFTEPSKATVEDVYEHWMESNPGWGFSTRKGKESAFRRHILPIIGKVRVHDLTPGRVQGMVNALRTQPAGWPQRPEGAPPNPPISESMIRRVLMHLRGLLNHAVRMEMVHRNVAARVPLPKVQARRRQPWSLAEVRAVVTWCEAQSVDELWTRDYWIVALGTGLRKQELRGLRWSDVDLKEKLLNVRQVALQGSGERRIKKVPKSEAGWRTVDFDDVTVRAFERQQHVSGDNALVFPAEDGGILGSWKLAGDMERVAEGAGVRVIPVYDTRHSHGTLLAAAGVNPKVLSIRMGHATVAMTLDVYVQPDRGAQRAAGSVMASLLEPAVTAAATSTILTVDSASGGNSVKTTGVDGGASNVKL